MLFNRHFLESKSKLTVRISTIIYWCSFIFFSLSIESYFSHILPWMLFFAFWMECFDLKHLTFCIELSWYYCQWYKIYVWCVHNTSAPAKAPTIKPKKAKRKRNSPHNATTLRPFKYNILMGPFISDSWPVWSYMNTESELINIDST